MRFSYLRWQPLFRTESSKIPGRVLKNHIAEVIQTQNCPEAKMGTMVGKPGLPATAQGRGQLSFKRLTRPGRNPSFQ